MLNVCYRAAGHIRR